MAFGAHAGRPAQWAGTQQAGAQQSSRAPRGTPPRTTSRWIRPQVCWTQSQCRCRRCSRSQPHLWQQWWLRRRRAAPSRRRAPRRIAADSPARRRRSRARQARRQRAPRMWPGWLAGRGGACRRLCRRRRRRTRRGRGRTRQQGATRQRTPGPRVACTGSPLAAPPPPPHWRKQRVGQSVGVLPSLAPCWFAAYT